MSFSIKIDTDAIRDIQSASDWHEHQSKGLGERYKNQVKKQINSLKQNPFLYPVKYNSVRCFKIDKFPFLVHFTIDEKLKVITVFAVFHTSRNPEIWKKRNK